MFGDFGELVMNKVSAIIGSGTLRADAELLAAGIPHRPRLLPALRQQRAQGGAGGAGARRAQPRGGAKDTIE